METDDDFDVSQSTDVSNEDTDFPLSASQSATQPIPQSGNRGPKSEQWEKTNYSQLMANVTQLEEDCGQLRQKMEEISRTKSMLELQKVDMEGEINTLKASVKQEQEKQRNTSLICEKTNDLLRKMEEKYHMEVQDKHVMELTMKKMEMEMRLLTGDMKRLEEERNEIQHMLAQERNTRNGLESLLNSQLLKQEMEEENRKTLSQIKGTIAQVSEASMREQMQQNSVFHEQLGMLQAELEQTRAHSRQEECRHTEKMEALQEKLEDCKRDLKLSEETLTQAVYQYNIQMSTLKSESNSNAARLDQERGAKEKLRLELEGALARLEGNLRELEQSHKAREEAELVTRLNREEISRLKETIQTISEQLSQAESKIENLDGDSHRASLSLTEKTFLLEMTERDRQQACTRIQELETSLHGQKEQSDFAMNEALQLRQQLEEERHSSKNREQIAMEAQEHLGHALESLRQESEQRVRKAEETCSQATARNTMIQEQLNKLEAEKHERDAALRGLQEEMTETVKKMCVAEASLEMSIQYRSSLEEERQKLRDELEKKTLKLEECQELYIQGGQIIQNLKNELQNKEKLILSIQKQLEETMSVLACKEKTVQQLEGNVQQMERENTKLTAETKLQSDTIDILQRDAQQATLVRDHMEELASKLQDAKKNLEEKLSEATQKQNTLTQSVQEAHKLWEEEVNARTTMCMRMAEVEKEKGELASQVKTEKKKNQKLAEIKKTAETKLQQEVQRNSGLQKEVLRLKGLVKTSKKKGTPTVTSTPSTSCNRGISFREEVEVNPLEVKVKKLSIDLEMEAEKSSKLDMENKDLKEKLLSLDWLEKTKKQLEEELNDLRMQMESRMYNQSLSEQYRREAEERNRHEIQKKLEQSQCTLEHIRIANENYRRVQLEEKYREMEAEMEKLRASQQESATQKSATQMQLERYRKLYTEELDQRKKMVAKLERFNVRLAEANTKLLSERQRSKAFITSLNKPALDCGLSSTAGYGSLLGPLHSNLESCYNTPDDSKSKIDNYIERVQNDLKGNIEKALSNDSTNVPRANCQDSHVEQDPITRATQQYVKVIKDKFKIPD